jgi:hypothetical protein
VSKSKKGRITYILKENFTAGWRLDMFFVLASAKAQGVKINKTLGKNVWNGIFDIIVLQYHLNKQAE